jgi:hypothetical protein
VFAFGKPDLDARLIVGYLLIMTHMISTVGLWMLGGHDGSECIMQPEGEKPQRGGCIARSTTERVGWRIDLAWQSNPHAGCSRGHVPMVHAGLVSHRVPPQDI